MRRWAGLSAAVLLLLTACQQQSPPPAAEVLRISISRDVDTLDPAQLHQPGVGESLIRNVFDGLYKFENNLNEVPDLASGMPQISTDSKTWTFHLRPDAKFGNGDTVTADDVIFSWTRAAAVNGPDSLVFQTVVGYGAVNSGLKTTLDGLSAPDNRTVVARLSAPSAFWFVELGLWPAYVLNHRVVVASGDQDWWKSPQNLNAAATGPFQLSGWQRGVSLDFTPTPTWWGGGTGTLSRVHAEIVADPAETLSRYESGDLDIVGYAPAEDRPPDVPIDAVKRYKSDRTLAAQVHSIPWNDLLRLRFNTRTGPLAGADATLVRKALSQAIDRKALAASAACDGGVSCVAATGGAFLPGLQGYLGDNKDPNAVFDPAGAKAALVRWDPDGTKARSLRIWTFPAFQSLVQELQRQWQLNLGIKVPFDLGFNPPSDVVIFAAANFIDYDNPDNTLGDFVDSRDYSNPAFNALEAAANASAPVAALPLYVQAEKLIQADVVYAPLVYRLRVLLVKPNVVGAGSNALYEYYWTGISIKTS